MLNFFFEKYFTLSPLCLIFIEKKNIMGQIKQLLDNLFELELDETQYPDDLQMDYEMWLLEKQQKELILQDFNFQTHE